MHSITSQETSHQPASKASNANIEIYQDLNDHAHLVRAVLKDGPIDNQYVRGQLQMHLEKVHESLFDMATTFKNQHDMPSDILVNATDPPADHPASQQLALKIVMGSLKRVSTRISRVTNGVRKAPQARFDTFFGEALRKLNNDQHRFRYFLQ